MMTNPARILLAHAAIMLAVCVGGWMMLVKPNVDELAQHENTLNGRTASDGAMFDQQSVAPAAERLAIIKQRLHMIKAYNALAADSSRLYGRIMDMADQHGVRVQSLQPTSVKQPNDNSRISINRINLSVQGDYDRVAGFLDALSGMEAFMKPVQLDVLPTKTAEGALVDLNFTCELIGFQIDQSLATLGESDAQH